MIFSSQRRVLEALLTEQTHIAMTEQAMARQGKGGSGQKEDCAANGESGAGQSAELQAAREKAEGAEAELIKVMGEAEKLKAQMKRLTADNEVLRIAHEKDARDKEEHKHSLRELRQHKALLTAKQDELDEATTLAAEYGQHVSGGLRVSDEIQIDSFEKLETEVAHLRIELEEREDELAATKKELRKYATEAGRAMSEEARLAGQGGMPDIATLLAVFQRIEDSRRDLRRLRGKMSHVAPRSRSLSVHKRMTDAQGGASPGGRAAFGAESERMGPVAEELERVMDRIVKDMEALKHSFAPWLK